MKNDQLVIKSINDQTKIFNDFFGLNIKIDFALPTLPSEADGWFVFPKNRDIFSLLKTRAMTNYLERINVYRFERTENALEKIGDAPYSVVACQLGKKYVDKMSLEDAHNLFGPSEFGLTTDMVASIILTHPEIFYLSPGFVCSGQRLTSLKDGGMQHTPILYHLGKRIVYSSERISIGQKNILTGFLEKNIFDSYKYYDTECYNEGCDNWEEEE